MPRLVNVKTLNDLFGIGGDDWMEMDDNHEFCGIPPLNDIGGEDCFWNVATPEMKEARNNKISDTYNALSDEGWRQLISHRLEGSTQAQKVTLDYITFQSKNQAARYAMKKYGVSRNTAIRYIDEGRDFANKKRKVMKYGGDYTGAKYD